MFKRGLYLLTGAVGVHWRLNKTLFLWLGLFLLIGIAVGAYTAFNVRIKVDHISQNLIDTNLFRVVRPTATFGGIIMSRLFSFALIFGLIFLLCMNRWTQFFVFLIAVYLGFNYVINLYWIIARFGVATGFVLVLIYAILLAILDLIIMIAMVYCLRFCEPVRNGGFRGAIVWKDFFRGASVFFIGVMAFALVEFILFFLIISKIVFVV